MFQTNITHYHNNDGDRWVRTYITGAITYESLMHDVIYKYQIEKKKTEKIHQFYVHIVRKANSHCTDLNRGRFHIFVLLPITCNLRIIFLNSGQNCPCMSSNNLSIPRVSRKKSCHIYIYIFHFGNSVSFLRKKVTMSTCMVQTHKFSCLFSFSSMSK